MELRLLRERGQRVMRSGHRGAKGHAPENTFASFEKGVELGVDVVELDVHLSNDGELVVIHDHSVDRTTNGQGLVRDMTVAELRQLDAGSWFDPAYAGQHIPALSEVLEWAKGRVRLAIEIKNGPIFYPGIAEKTVQALRDHDMMDQAMLISFDHICLRECKMLAPEVVTGILYVARLVDPVSVAHSAGASSLNPNWSLVTPDVVEQAHAAGLAVSPWVPNDVNTIRMLEQMGVDSIGTDYPDLFELL